MAPFCRGLPFWCTEAEQGAPPIAIQLAATELFWDTTNTFHFRVGELMVTPLDFAMITGIPAGDRVIDPTEVILPQREIGALLGPIRARLGRL